MVTRSATRALVGVTTVMTGITKNDLAALVTPLTIMTTSTTPGEREPGTGVIIFVSVHELGALMTPPTETVLAPCALPKPLPVIVNGAPTGLTGPTVGDIRVITGEANAAGRKVQMNSKK